ncbi:MAG: hypothetical protein HYY06_05895 [Deltaproteobacteria bacterium]|nr:hypothetical protein [Deltaproteobacteria bacterium]
MMRHRFRAAALILTAVGCGSPASSGVRETTPAHEVRQAPPPGLATPGTVADDGASAVAPSCVLPDAAVRVACAAGDPRAARTVAEVEAVLAVRATDRTRARRHVAPDVAVAVPFDPATAALAADVHALRCAASGADRARLTYGEARLHYQHHHWDDAALLFEEVAGEPAVPVELLGFAADLALDTLNILLSRVHRSDRDCQARMQSMITLVQPRLCPGPDEERCGRLTLIETQLRERTTR